MGPPPASRQAASPRLPRGLQARRPRYETPKLQRWLVWTPLSPLNATGRGGDSDLPATVPASTRALTSPIPVASTHRTYYSTAGRPREFPSPRSIYTALRVRLNTRPTIDLAHKKTRPQSRSCMHPGHVCLGLSTVAIQAPPSSFLPVVVDACFILRGPTVLLSVRSPPSPRVSTRPLRGIDCPGTGTIFKDDATSRWAPSSRT